MDYFKVAEPMRGYRGDTFSPWRILVTDDYLLPDLINCSMRLDLEDKYTPGKVVFTKSCEYIAGSFGKGFQVQLDSEDTEQLCGMYTIHYVLTDTSGKDYRKLVGTLEVLPVPQEVG